MYQLSAETSVFFSYEPQNEYNFCAIKFQQNIICHVYINENYIFNNIFIKSWKFAFYMLKIEYEAFCAWTLLKTDGLLYPSDLSNGLVQYKNQYYAFSSVDAADLFMQNPDMWVEY